MYGSDTGRKAAPCFSMDWVSCSIELRERSVILSSVSAVFPAA